MSCQRLPSQPSLRALNLACLLLIALGVSNFSSIDAGAIPKTAQEPHKPIDRKLSEQVHFDKEQEHNEGNPPLTRVP